MKKIGMAMMTVFLLAGCGSQQSTPHGAAQQAAAQLSPSAAASSSAGTDASNQAALSSGKALSAGTPLASKEQPLAPEKNPVGDIPDTQAFVSYKSPQGGYTFKSPEGWARTEQGTDVSFIDKFDGVKVKVEQVASPPTVATVKSNQAAELVQNGRAVKITAIKQVKLPGGDAVWVKFESNSDPNPVTNKQIRQDNESYYFYKNGKLATLTLWAPMGADNVDQWKLMAESFGWN